MPPASGKSPVVPPVALYVSEIPGGPKSDREGLTFRSILFDQIQIDVSDHETPEFFRDLNLDQIVASIVTGREEYNLRPFFDVPLRDVREIRYRQGNLRDLENPILSGYIRSFADDMRAMRKHLAQTEKPHYPYEKKRWSLDAIDVYCNAVTGLAHNLTLANLSSRGFLSFSEYLTAYTSSESFVSLLSGTRELTLQLSRISYCLHVEGARITVARYNSEADYGAEVLQTFAKFRNKQDKNYRFDFPSSPRMNHVEAAVLERVVRLYPDVFRSLDDYSVHYQHYLDETIATFDREVQFYIAYLEHIDRFKKNGLAFCYPTIADHSKEISGNNVFDLALAGKIANHGSNIITNDFCLRDPERIVVVSGANQGGKTTFARMFGQIHYLASIGCLVPGTQATLFLFDQIFTHFECEERITDLTSKLENDLLRIRSIIEQATPDSIIILNESFVSTTLDDSLFLNTKIMREIIRRNLLCVSVTFLDELASLGETVVSMVSEVDPADPTVRTFKIVRKTADGLAYAAAIAKKYCLTYECVKERIAL